MLRIIDWLKRINYGVAIIVGLALLACIFLILVDILLRKFGMGFSGAQEISGYVMASVSSWGICYALTAKSHVRIDILRNKGAVIGRSLFDIVALSATSFVALYAAYYVIPVVEKSVKYHSISNTTLEMPLVIPQSIWMAGWIWFAVSSCVLLICSVWLVMRQKYDLLDKIIGTGTKL